MIRLFFNIHRKIRGWDIMFFGTIRERNTVDMEQIILNVESEKKAEEKSTKKSVNR